MIHHNKENLNRRCPRLGGPVSFRYCLESAEDEAPCWKIIECWWEIFDIATYLEKCLPLEKLNKLMGKRPVPKIESLVELIQKAQKNLQPPKK
jgi:hypothetical protein